MMNNLVSIIVPIYNVNDYMDLCMESLLHQTYKNIEIILIDDGSTDGSANKCDLIADIDNRVIVIHKKNGGLSSARNAGLDIAKGKFILFVDGDDYIDLNTVDTLINIWEDSKINPDLIQFNYKEVQENEQVKIDNSSNQYKISYSRIEFFENLYEIGGGAASACTKLYKKELFNNLRFKNGILHEDENMITDILSKINSCIYLDKILYYYVTRQGSIINSSFMPKKMDVFIPIEYRIEYLRKINSEHLLNKEFARYYMTILNMYCNARKDGYNKECKILKNRLKQLLKTNNIEVSGKYKIIELLCRININLITLYYYIRKFKENKKEI